MKGLVKTVLFILAIGLQGACGAIIPGIPMAIPTETPTVKPTVSVNESWYAFSEAEKKTLASLKKVDDYPLYVMQYYGGSVPREIPGRSGAREATPVPNWACSLFTVLLDEDHMLYGRNFDWQDAPALLLVTDPPDGYASFSMVDLAFLGYSNEAASRLTDLPLEERGGLLGAPQLPFDGMNENGLAIGMAAVPQDGTSDDPARERIGSITIIREILDHARDVDEALDLIRNFSIDFRGGPPVHYLIADANGRAVLVEFYHFEMYVFENDQPWHFATNFLRSSVDDPAGQCWRYDRIKARLDEKQGFLDSESAMALLAEVAQESTQWSVVYQMARREMSVAMGRDYENVYSFRMSDYIKEV
jgi:hypothetical protein